jgi:nuclear pore complex protein Nup85
VLILKIRASIKSRETLILEYAEYTRSDPGLWRLSKEYFYSCGPIGQERGDQVLMHVPLQLTSSKSSDGVDQGGNPSEGDVTGVIGELMAMCAQKGRESARRTICKVS